MKTYVSHVDVYLIYKYFSVKTKKVLFKIFISSQKVKQAKHATSI